MRFIYFIVAILLLVISPSKIFAWDTVIGHPNITLSALNKSDNLDRFLGDFGLAGEMFNSRDSRDFGPHSAKGWIFWGSIWEDYSPDHATTCLLQAECRRFLNHYYDPVNKIGLNYSGYGGGVAPIWGKTGEGVDGPNQWSWSKARYYLLNALIAGSEEERNKNFAFAFRSLGQVVHLLEDMSQPGHVRNDPHVSPSDDILGSMIFNSSRLEEWANNNGSLVSGYAASSGDARAYPAFDNYFNGLAAISNTNFLSDDTIFKNYSMPSEEQAGVVYDAVEDGDGHRGLGIYYVKTGGLLTGHKLANAGYLWYDLSFRKALKATIFDTALKIDDKVAQENAQKLIPMAVEFSSGLLNYFFRGQIDMKKDTQNAGKYTIENLSSETMSGTFSLYYDDKNGNRYKVQGATWTLSIAPNGKSDPQDFTEPTDAKEKGKYMLVFNGTLGSEEGAVVGEVVKFKPEGGCTDSFTDVNYTFLNDHKPDVGRRWFSDYSLNIVDNKVRPVWLWGGALCDSENIQNGYVSIDLDIIGNRNIWTIANLFFRASNGSYYVLAHNFFYKIYLYKVDHGGSILLKSVYDATPPPINLKAEFIGPVINVYVNNSPVLTAYDSTLTTGKTGIFLYPNMVPYGSEPYWGITADNFEARPY